MIYSFGGRNFFSFREDFFVDFRVPEIALNRDIFFPTCEGYRCNSVMGVFGANASGKTHLLKALGFLQNFIQHYAKIKDPDEDLEPVFFKFSDSPDKTTHLFLEFEMEGEHFRYDVEFNPKRVLSEALKKRKTRFNYLFERAWDENTGKYRLKTQDFGSIDLKLAQRHNASLISTAILIEHPVARKFDRFFDSFYGNLSPWGRNERHDPRISNLIQVAEFFEEESDLLDWVNSRIAHFDLGLDAIEIRKSKFLNEEGEPQELPFPIGVHKIGRKKYPLALFQESRGTQSLFVLLRYILPVLKNGGMAYIDEFELGLHSHMIPRLIDLFYSAKHNTNRAQLIFSTHADYAIQRLEKYQMVLVEKDQNGISESFRLDNVQGVRNDENHYAKYHAGAYGGVPQF